MAWNCVLRLHKILQGARIGGILASWRAGGFCLGEVGQKRDGLETRLGVEITVTIDTEGDTMHQKHGVGSAVPTLIHPNPPQKAVQMIGQCLAACAGDVAGTTRVGVGRVEVAIPLTGRGGEAYGWWERAGLTFLPGWVKMDGNAPGRPVI